MLVALVLGISTACAIEDDDDDGAADDSGTDSGAATTDADTGEPQTCVDAQQAADEFIANNSACEVDEDCTQVAALCVPSSVCGAVPLNAGYDANTWAAIDAALQTCTECGGDPCGACTLCDGGVCRLSVGCG